MSSACARSSARRAAPEGDDRRRRPQPVPARVGHRELPERHACSRTAARAAWPGRETPGRGGAGSSRSPSSTTTPGRSPGGSSSSQTCFDEPRTVGAGGALTPLWQDGTPRWFPPEFYWVFGCSYTGLPEELAPVRNPIGANMAVRAQVLREIGGFREGGSEDASSRDPLPRRRQGRRQRPRRHRARNPRQAAVAGWGLALPARRRGSATRSRRERATLGYFVRRSFEEGDGKARLARPSAPSRASARSVATSPSCCRGGFSEGLRELLRGDPMAASAVGGDRRRRCSRSSGRASWRALAAPSLRTAAPMRRAGGRSARAGAARASRRCASTKSSSATPLPGAPAGHRDGRELPYGSALCLVRLHGQPLGLVEVEIPADGLPPTRLAELIQAELGEEIDRHLSADGLGARPRRRRASPDGAAPLSGRARGLPRSALRPSRVVVPTRNRPDSRRRDRRRSVLELALPRGPLRGDRRRQRLRIGRQRLTGEAAPNGGAPVRVVSEAGARRLQRPQPGPATRPTARSSSSPTTTSSSTMTGSRRWSRAFDRGERGGRRRRAHRCRASWRPRPRHGSRDSAASCGDSRRRVFDLADPPPDRPLFPFTVGDFGSWSRTWRSGAKLLRELGGFDPALGTATPALAGEDLEAMLRVLLAGHEVVYEPAAIVCHAHQRELRGVRAASHGATGSGSPPA